MNKKREPYDRITVGERIRHKRIQLGLSQDELAVRINRATKYCSDIERGMCGMSIKTMLAIAKALDMNLDYMMFGEISETGVAAERCSDPDPYNRKGARLPKELCDTPSQTIYCCNREVAYIDPFFFTTSGIVRKSIFTSSPRLQFKM